MIFALIGNQNSGKTTLFNQLTGSNQHVGNFPGVTVQGKSGKIKDRHYHLHKDHHHHHQAKDHGCECGCNENDAPKGQNYITAVDLPGIYSLSTHTSEEVISRDFLLHGKSDCIINIVDATNIERNLYLTLQVIDLGIPMVLALNMMDELTSNGGSVKVDKLAEDLGIPVVPICAIRNEGVDELVAKAIEVAESKLVPQRIDFCTGPVHRSLHAMEHLIEDHSKEKGIPRRFAASRLLEGDDILEGILSISPNEKEIVEHCVLEMEGELGTDREAAFADMRYSAIADICKDSVIKPRVSKESVRSVKADKLLTNKFLGIPIFIGLMLLIFWLTFTWIGQPLSDWLGVGIEWLTERVAAAMEGANVNPILQSLVIDGVFAGVGSVLSFLPLIAVLFLFLSLLEDSGYMARVAFIMDRPLRKLGLSGKSFVPMLIGFGCSVPAIMATRTLYSDQDKKLTTILIPFMTCGAKVPVYALFAAIFFANNPARAITLMYLFAILLGIICAFLLKKVLFKGNPVPFIMELPNYRIPSVKSTFILVWDRVKDFLLRAFTIIFVATIVVWFLQSFDFSLNVVGEEEISRSMLAVMGNAISGVFAPLGFGNWQSVTALISGFMAKEVIISTFAVLTGSVEGETLNAAMKTLFTQISSISFMAFVIIYTPCFAAIAAMKRELGTKWTIGVILFQIGLAWVVAFLIYSICKIFMG